MKDCELTFLVHAECLTDEAIDRLGADLDVVCGETAYGDGFVTLTWSADSALEAVRSASRALEADYGVRIIELGRDLVNQAEIAVRTGTTRQAVHHWIRGVRRKGGFPRPFDPTNGLWLWGEVHDWALQNGLALDDADMAYPTRAEHDAAAVELRSGAERPEAAGAA